MRVSVGGSALCRSDFVKRSMDEIDRDFGPVSVVRMAHVCFGPGRYVAEWAEQRGVKFELVRNPVSESDSVEDCEKLRRYRVLQGADLMVQFKYFDDDRSRMAVIAASVGLTVVTKTEVGGLHLVSVDG